MIILENHERKLVSYPIPTAVGGGAAHTVAIVERSTDGTSRSGQKALRTETRTYPTTLTLAARDTAGAVSDELPDAYAEVPEIRRAIAEHRLLKWVVEKPPVQVPAPALDVPPEVPALVTDQPAPHAKPKPGRKPPADKE